MDSGTVTQPAAPEQRTLSGLDLGLLWFGAAIAMSELWAGGLEPLTRLGLWGGLAAILLGRAVGNGLMAGMARLGAVSGLPTFALARPVFGRSGVRLPAVLNIVQLIGWTAWMIFIGAGYLAILLQASGIGTDGPIRYAAVLLIGGLCTWWAVAFAHRGWWKVVERAAIYALFALTVAMTVLIAMRGGFSGSLAPTGAAGAGGLGLLIGMDLVIAMSVSWLPLVADYSRFARTARGGAAGTFWGYFVGGTWMYAVGLAVALATGSAAPDRLVVELLAGSGLGWVLLAVMLVLLSTATTTFLDIYSTVVSAQSIWPRVHEQGGAVVSGLAGTVLALALDAHSYEPFLLAIGAVFLPAFTVVLTDWYLLRRPLRHAAEQVPARFRWAALAAWAIGFLVYDWAQGFPSLLFFVNAAARVVALVGGPSAYINPPLASFDYGASLPCIAATVLTYLLLRGFRRHAPA